MTITYEEYKTAINGAAKIIDIQVRYNTELKNDNAIAKESVAALRKLNQELQDKLEQAQNRLASLQAVQEELAAEKRANERLAKQLEKTQRPRKRSSTS